MMPEYLAPGVYVEEVSSGIKPIEGVSTRTAAMLGQTERGPVAPRMVTSFLEFQRWYGGFIPDQSYLAYAVQGFFDNGGQRCYIGRITGAGAVATDGALGNLTVTAIGPGTWGNNIRICITNAKSNENDAQHFFNLTVIYEAVNVDEYISEADPTKLVNLTVRDPILEVFEALTHEPGKANSVDTIVNSGSQLIRVTWGENPQARPANQGFQPFGDNGNPGADVAAGDYTGAREPNYLQDADLLGRGRGLLAIADIDDVSILLAPDEVREGFRDVTSQVIAQCETLKDRFAVVSTDQDKRTKGQVMAVRAQYDTSYGGFYYPWIKVFDRVNNRKQLIPPSGHVAGIMARVDIERGVHKAPANEIVRGAIDLEFPVTDEMQNVLNPHGVNCIRDFRKDGRGIRLWGARTMSSDPEWKYVNVRRLALFIEESIEEGTRWVVFEPNQEPTWAKVRRSITNFLISVWRSGALMGATQEKAFFVRCDRTTMTEDDIKNGRMICYIGVAPIIPAEFVIVRISQKTQEAMQ